MVHTCRQLGIKKMVDVSRLDMNKSLFPSEQRPHRSFTKTIYVCFKGIMCDS